MKAINKEILLNQLEEKVESHVEIAISVFQNLAPAALLKASATGGWSIAQCLQHLNLYGHFYLPEIEKRLQGTEGSPADTFQSTWLGHYFTRMLDPATGNRKIRAFKGYIPAAQLDAHAVVAEFIAQQERLLDLLRKAHAVNLNTIRVPISIARFIRLRVGDVFQFLIAHNERHIQQAKRNL